MINLFNVNIERLYIHKIGNKARLEELFISREPFELTDEIRPVIKEFFLKPFREKEERYFQFSEDSELQDFLVPFNMEMSQDIAQHLYDQSIHPHIKSGELYVCDLQNIEINNEKVSGIGIFKSEMKYDFIQFQKKESRLDAILQEGVNLNKLDKGAIIIATAEPKVLYMDSNRYDTKYWVENFLGLEELNDSRAQTKNYLKFCRDFAKDVIRPAEDRKAEISFVNDAFQFFAATDEFEEDVFVDLVPEEMHSEFERYQFEKAPVYGFDVSNTKKFAIENDAVSEALKKVKGDIELDTGLTIKIDKGTGAAKHLEKGWDEEKQMYYYLSYFNTEN
ncbi:nucleoid associated protein NdpA [Gramella sp. Hel_I_59]|uniref:nucleoid-associated protein n=1 Tax=Gramella sp. Hel_I_59 TaxID=1249978 RepID=UPI00115474F0|nr:nucleoid-associated protein [Gramella sp. Hel_I_59]TQI72252.1 nucleoid associated protein NdpA [Gramella sp. Hel_I_59]